MTAPFKRQRQFWLGRCLKCQAVNARSSSKPVLCTGFLSQLLGHKKENGRTTKSGRLASSAQHPAVAVLALRPSPHPEAPSMASCRVLLSVEVLPATSHSS